MTIQITKLLTGHTSPETAYVVEDYPWGYRLRTTIRYWIETKINRGQRFARQTKNPKTGRWCAPQYGTYASIEVLYLDNEEHVQHYPISDHRDFLRMSKQSRDDLVPTLDDYQQFQLRELLAVGVVLDKLAWKIETGGKDTAPAITEEDLERINRAIAVERTRVSL